MSGVTRSDRLYLVGGWSRNLAAWVIFVVTLLCLFVAFLVGWSAGMSGEHHGDEGIRDILVAVGLLAFGMIGAVLFVGFFLVDILVRVRRLDGQAQRSSGNLPGNG